MVKLKCAVLGKSKMHRDIARYQQVKVIIALWRTMNPLVYLYKWNDFQSYEINKHSLQAKVMKFYNISLNISH